MEQHEFDFKWLQFFSYAHLYKQQYTIDEFKIDYEEFKRRLDAENFIENCTLFADRFQDESYAYETGIILETLELYNNPPQ